MKKLRNLWRRLTYKLAKTADAGPFKDWTPNLGPNPEWAGRIARRAVFPERALKESWKR